MADVQSQGLLAFGAGSRWEEKRPCLLSRRRPSGISPLPTPPFPPPRFDSSAFLNIPALIQALITISSTRATSPSSDFSDPVSPADSLGADSVMPYSASPAFSAHSPSIANCRCRHLRSQFGSDVTVGPGCVIESGVRLSSCSLMKGVRVKSSAHVSGSIIGWHSTVGESAQVCSMAVLGEDVHVRDSVFLNGTVVLPHKEINSHFLKPEIRILLEMVQYCMFSVC